MLQRCEQEACWPQGMLHWRVVYIPKENGTGPTPTMKVRPISVGPAVYRLWPAVRARHVGAMLAPRFRPHQAATAGSIGPHGLLLDMEVQQDTHRKEQERLKQVEATAERIGTLPVAISTRSAVANCMLAPKAVWDQFITGRKGPGHGSWKQIYRKAAMGCFHPGGRASRDLELVSRWGHVVDLGFLACQRYLVSLQKWWWVFGRHVRGPLPRLPSMQLVSSELGRLGWHAVNWGQWSWQGIELDCRQRIGELLASFHSLRESWRASTFLRWVSSRTRRDSEIARGMHLQYSEGLGKILRGLNKELGGDSCAVMVGGMSTPATCAEQNRPLTCPYCRIDVVPCLDHVLWHCRAFADDRGIARPQCELAARLGWAPDMTKEACRALLVQMGVIRGKEAALRRRLRAGGALHL